MTKTITLERDLAHPPAKVWRALTESHLMAEWLMQNDFEPKVGKAFSLRAEPMPPHWNGVTDCEVLEIEPERLLSYTWNSSGEEKGRVNTVLTFTLTPTASGTHLKLEQSGFEGEGFYQGALHGWPRMLEKMAETIAGL